MYNVKLWPSIHSFILCLWKFPKHNVQLKVGIEAFEIWTWVISILKGLFHTKLNTTTPSCWWSKQNVLPNKESWVLVHFIFSLCEWSEEWLCHLKRSPRHHLILTVDLFEAFLGAPIALAKPTLPSPLIPRNTSPTPSNMSLYIPKKKHL